MVYFTLLFIRVTFLVTTHFMTPCQICNFVRSFMLMHIIKNEKVKALYPCSDLSYTYCKNNFGHYFKVCTLGLLLFRSFAYYLCQCLFVK